MSISAQKHREDFERQGYTVFENVLDAKEIAEAEAVIDGLITRESRKPLVTGDSLNGRRQLDAKNCEPRLAMLAGHPRVLAAVKMLAGRPFRLFGTPVPCVTFNSPPGHERFEWGYHVDWRNRPPEPGDETQVLGVIHLTTVRRNGGAFMLIPGSHHVVTEALKDPALAKRALDQDFKNFPGLGEPREMCVPAGSVVFFHAYLVHDRSENLHDQPRKVVFLHYCAWGEGEYERRDKAKLAAGFHPKFLESMDDRTRSLCGLS